MGCKLRPRVLYNAVMADTTTESLSQAPTSPSSPRRPRLLVRRLAFAVGLLGLLALFAVLRPFEPRTRTLVGAGLIAAGGVVGFLGFGKEPRLGLKAWRSFFAAWAFLLSPLLLNIAVGLAKEGWPSGKFNRPVARLLTWILIATVPAFLTGLLAVLRTYRLAAGLAVSSGLAALVCSRWLLIETTPIKLKAMLPLDNVLHIIGFLSKLVAFASIPVGIALTVGGLLILLRGPGPRTR